MSTDPGPWIAAVRGSHERLRGLVEPLGVDQLGELSYASEWTLAQVLSHLGSGAEIFTLLLDAGLSGTGGPAPEAFGAIWDVWNGKRPEEQAADSLTANETLVSRFERLSPAQAEAFRVDLIGSERDLAGFVALRLSEHALHTWDVAVALDPTATVSPEAVDLLLGIVDQFVALVGRPLDSPVRLRVTTSDPEREFLLSVTDAAHLEPWQNAAADHVGEAGEVGGLRLPAEVFLRLVYGRLTEADEKTLTLTGAALADLRRVFPGF